MESAIFSRSINGSLQSVTHTSFLEKPAPVPTSRDVSRCLSFQPSLECQKLIFSKSSRRTSSLSCAKAAETTATLTSAATSETVQGLSQIKNDQKSTFPNGFEALVLGVCDETDIAEIKLKVGQFEMHLKRNIGSPIAAAPVAPPVAAPASPPPAPAKAKVESGPASPPASPQASPKKETSPFAKTESAKATKLAALDASASNTYVLVSSPTVGKFRSGRTLKGKKQPPSCKEGDLIKEGQTIGFLDQFGSELPVRSEVAGEVLKVLYKDGEPVGYGDPLVAVLPSFHRIK